MRNSSHQLSLVRGHARWRDLRASSRERRRARSQRRHLARDLSSVTTAAEALDILATVRDSDDPAAEQIRDVVTRNLLRRVA